MRTIEGAKLVGICLLLGWMVAMPASASTDWESSPGTATPDEEIPWIQGSTPFPNWCSEADLLDATCSEPVLLVVAEPSMRVGPGAFVVDEVASSCPLGVVRLSALALHPDTGRVAALTPSGSVYDGPQSMLVGTLGIEGAELSGRDGVYFAPEFTGLGWRPGTQELVVQKAASQVRPPSAVLRDPPPGRIMWGNAGLTLVDTGSGASRSLIENDTFSGYSAVRWSSDGRWLMARREAGLSEDGATEGGSVPGGWGRRILLPEAWYVIDLAGEQEPRPALVHYPPGRVYTDMAWLEGETFIAATTVSDPTAAEDAPCGVHRFEASAGATAPQPQPWALPGVNLYAVAVSPDQSVVGALAVDRVYLLDAATGEVQEVIDLPEGAMPDPSLPGWTGNCLEAWSRELMADLSARLSWSPSGDRLLLHHRGTVPFVPGPPVVIDVAQCTAEKLCEASVSFAAWMPGL